MRSKIFKCKVCQRYTISQICPKCSGNASNPLPPRFSPQDRYGKYRRMLRTNK